MMYATECNPGGGEHLRAIVGSRSGTLATGEPWFDYGCGATGCLTCGCAAEPSRAPARGRARQEARVIRFGGLSAGRLAAMAAAIESVQVLVIDDFNREAPVHVTNRTSEAEELRRRQERVANAREVARSGGIAGEQRRAAAEAKRARRQERNRRIAGA